MNDSTTNRGVLKDIAEDLLVPLGGYSRVTDVNPVRDRSGRLVLAPDGLNLFRLDCEHVFPGVEPSSFSVVTPMNADDARELHFSLFANELEDDEEVFAEGLARPIPSGEGSLFASDWVSLEVASTARASEPLPDWTNEAQSTYRLDYEPVFADEA